MVNLDVSKNPILTGIFCAKNNLISLNVKNGNNTNFQVLFNDYRNNPLLSCINVDDTTYSNTNWSDYKDTNASYSKSCGPAYTNIPDSNFENKLIALGVDNDGANGKILTSSVVSLTTLDVSNSSITDITGIESFVNLEVLNVSNNQLATLYIPTLKKIKTIDSSNNILKSLDFSENKVLETLNFSNNQVLDVQFGYQTLLETLKAGLNKLTTIDISSFVNLKTLEVNDNKLTNLTLFSNNLLSVINCNNNLISSLDVSQNTTLNSLYCGNNKLTNLNIVKNILLRQITCENNLLTQLNLKNGKNNLFTNYDFRNNASLQCIEVDDENYSNLNWASKKDTIANYNLFCGSFTLIPDPKFEDKLIALGIDIDGKNGKILTTSVTDLTNLNLSNSGIADLSGIQDFINLKTLNVSSNFLLKLDLSKNILLEVLNCSFNQIIVLDFTKQTKLTDLYCNNNNLDNLNIKNTKNTLLKNVDFRINPKLSCIIVDDEVYANTNWSSKKDATSNFLLFCGDFTILSSANFEIKLINLGIDKDGYNGKVLTSSIAEITTLDVSSSYISNINGIQDFKKLKILNCNNNVIATFDLSKNIELEKLDCSNNLINSMNVSQNFLLSSLLCSNNSLSNLDISRNTLLTTLNCHKNILANIDIVNNLSLNNLNCSSNQLTSLDISKNIFLTEINCSYNKIVNLNLLNNYSLTILDFNNNKLNSLDLSGNNNLMSLNCNYNYLSALEVSSLTSLSLLDCSHNLITYLDLIKNTNLTSVICYENNISDLDLSKCVALINLDYGYNPIISLNLKNGNNKNIPKLTFYSPSGLYCIQVDNKEYSDKNWIIINFSGYSAAVFSEDCSKITIIPDPNFEDALIKLGIDIDGKNGSVLTSRISDIKYLDISNSNISDLKGIQDFKAIKVLKCQLNNIKNLDLSNNLLLTYLDCYSNNISSLDISKSLLLTDLSCFSNKITSLDLSNNLLLTSLYCYSNKITRLDISNNKALIDIDCSNNSELSSLNIANGKNRSINPYQYPYNSNCNFKNNPNLGCIYVDDVFYANNNLLSYKDETAVYSRSCGEYFEILDQTLEKKLISLGIDKDGLNGKMLKSDAIKVTDLNISYSDIYDLSPIEYFTSLKSLNCSYNPMSKLILFYNNQLTSLNCSNTRIELLDLSQNKFLTDVSCSSTLLNTLALKNGNNKFVTNINLKNNANLTCIEVDDANYSNTNWSNNKDVTANYSNFCNNFTSIPDSNFEDKLIALGIDRDGKNGKIANNRALEITELSMPECAIKSLTGIQSFTNINSLNCTNNNLSTADLSKNVLLKSLDLSYNNLTNLDSSKNILLEYLALSVNNLTNLDISKNTLLKTLVSDNNLLTSLDVSKNTLLIGLSCANNQLTALDVYKNNLIERLGINRNKIERLDLSNCTKLTVFQGIENKLTNLNLKNGNNKNIDLVYSGCYGNPNLSCIKVDDVAYCNTNWKTFAPGTYFSLICDDPFLPSDNFVVESKSETCLNKNNGEINILAKATYAYRATINDVIYPFSNNVLKLINLTPGTYSISVTIPGEVFEQKFNVNIAKGAVVSGKSSIVNNKLSLEIESGTPPYLAYVNGELQLETSDAFFTVSANNGDLVEIKTAKACEGVYNKTVMGLVNTFSVYPNPTLGIFEIELNTSIKKIDISLLNINGTLISNKIYTVENGKVKLSLENQPAGFYIAKIELDSPEYLKIIKK